MTSLPKYDTRLSHKHYLGRKVHVVRKILFKKIRKIVVRKIFLHNYSEKNDHRIPTHCLPFIKQTFYKVYLITPGIRILEGDQFGKNGMYGIQATESQCRRTCSMLLQCQGFNFVRLTANSENGLCFLLQNIHRMSSPNRAHNRAHMSCLLY